MQGEVEKILNKTTQEEKRKKEIKYLKDNRVQTESWLTTVYRLMYMDSIKAMYYLLEDLCLDFSKDIAV